MTTALRLSALAKPWPKQQEFLNLTRTHEYTLFGGAAGPGKSYIARWWLLDLLLKWASQGLRDVRVGLFCEDYPALNDRHLSKVRSEFPPWLGAMNEQTHEFRLKPCYGGGVIAFRNLDKPEKYLSVEFAAIAVDELTRNKREVFDMLRSRKRWTGIEFSPFAGFTNPGGHGHGWVKKLWIDKDFSGDDDARLPADQFAFLPALPSDNPSLPSSYIATLAALPEKLRRAYLEGDWDVFAGQFFSEWRRDLHVVEPFKIPDSWPKWRAVDWGYGAPYCCLWFARSPEQRIFVYREQYAAGVVDAQQAQRIRDASRNERIRFTVADPSIWNRQPNGTSIAQVYANNGVEMIPANNDRAAGWQRVHEALQWVKFPQPTLQVFSTCTNLIRTLPEAVHDKIDVEDVADGDDHLLDCLRYALIGAATPSAQPTAVRFG